jgi:riboflavin kinase / FMN adenylyltransferase
MKILNLAEVEPGSGPRDVAIGTFDGVHLGHREVIRGADTVLTFDPHPLAVIHREATPKLIASTAVKRDLIAGLGVEELVVIPFDRGFSEQSPESFVSEVLIDRLGASRVSVGENFRFGQGARGTADLLRSHDEFETRVVPLVEVAGETVSSSHIRGLVAAGDVKQAAEFLGGPFLFEGEVVTGDRRGRDLGMPTANLVPDDVHLTPGHGVYAAWANVKPNGAHSAEPSASGHPNRAQAEPSASGFPAAVNVGVRPTFETGRGLLVEAHLIGFEGDLYGQQLRIAFLERMRGEKRFDSVDALVEQMNRDLAQASDIAGASPWSDLLLRFPAR